MSGMVFLCGLFILTVLPDMLLAITATHHDKPEEAQLSQMAAKMRNDTINLSLNVTLPNSERQKRLFPYMEYYQQKGQTYHHQRRPQPFTNQPRFRLLARKPVKNVEYTQELLPQFHRKPVKFTPFLKTNALQGSFTPIIRNYDYVPVRVKTVVPSEQEQPDYSSIYEKLSRLKFEQQQQQQPVYIPSEHGTTIETYTPTNIDIPATVPEKEIVTEKNVVYTIYRQKVPPPSPPPPRPQVQFVTVQPPIQTTSSKVYYTDEAPLAVYDSNPVYVNPPQIQYLSREKPSLKIPKPFIYTASPKPPVNTIIDDEYIAQKFTSLAPKIQEIYPEPVPSKLYYEVPQHQEPSPQLQLHVPEENPNSLQHLLKQLQNSNTLPQALTTANIDDSIRTLVKILDILKKQQKLSKPIQDVIQTEEENLADVGYNVQSEEDVHSFPANTVEGGTPGRPGIDYPALSTIPQTDFNCKTQRYKGFFGDPHTNCQVWHYCDLNGGQASFLCPNGTIFSQVALTCDWWYNVKCSSTAQLYVLNERLYKYILPLSPKFPEDYSGPLVDKYLALKFKEMEDKMRREKKGKQNKTKDEEDEEDEDVESDDSTEKASDET